MFSLGKIPVSLLNLMFSGSFFLSPYLFWSLFSSPYLPQSWFCFNVWHIVHPAAAIGGSGLIWVIKGSVVSFCLEVLFKVNIKVSGGGYWSTLFQTTVHLKKACLPLLEKSAVSTMGKGTWLMMLCVNTGAENDIHRGEGSRLSAGLGISHLSNVQGRCTPTLMTSSTPSFCVFEICLMIKTKSFFHLLHEASHDCIPPTSTEC